jgi:Flp pilus assembly pilin Flp
MTNDERDQMLMDILAKTSVVVDQVGRHDKELHGNGQPGALEVLRQAVQTQAECPARKATTEGGRGLRAVWAGIVVTALLGIGSSVQTAVSAHSGNVAAQLQRQEFTANRIEVAVKAAEVAVADPAIQALLRDEVKKAWTAIEQSRATIATVPAPAKVNP